MVFTTGDIKASISRRGPDSLGARRLLIHGKAFDSKWAEESRISTSLEEGAIGRSSFSDELNTTEGFVGEMIFLGATLQLRGVRPVVQPLVDEFGNILVYNGEVLVWWSVWLSCFVRLCMNVLLINGIFYIRWRAI